MSGRHPGQGPGGRAGSSAKLSPAGRTGGAGDLTVARTLRPFNSVPRPWRSRCFPSRPGGWRGTLRDLRKGGPSGWLLGPQGPWETKMLGSAGVNKPGRGRPAAAASWHPTPLHRPRSPPGAPALRGRRSLPARSGDSCDRRRARGRERPARSPQGRWLFLGGWEATRAGSPAGSHRPPGAWAPRSPLLTAAPLLPLPQAFTQLKRRTPA